MNWVGESFPPARVSDHLITMAIQAVRDDIDTHYVQWLATARDLITLFGKKRTTQRGPQVVLDYSELRAALRKLNDNIEVMPRDFWWVYGLGEPDEKGRMLAEKQAFALVNFMCYQHMQQGM